MGTFGYICIGVATAAVVAGVVGILVGVQKVTDAIEEDLTATAKARSAARN